MGVHLRKTGILGKTSAPAESPGEGERGREDSLPEVTGRHHAAHSEGLPAGKPAVPCHTGPERVRWANTIRARCLKDKVYVRLSAHLRDSKGWTRLAGRDVQVWRTFPSNQPCGASRRTEPRRRHNIRSFRQPTRSKIVRALLS